MEDFILFANPFWVNFLILVPLLIFYILRKNKLSMNKNILFFTAIFGISFGLIEAAVVIYLRAALGFLPGYQGTLIDVWNSAYSFSYNQQLVAEKLPLSLLTVELVREVGTIVMILSIAFIAANKLKERAAMFLWIFAFWDIFYYVFLFLFVRWPMNFTTPDLLFLIPEPWTSQVWFPILISALTIIAIFINLKSSKK